MHRFYCLSALVLALMASTVLPISLQAAPVVPNPAPASQGPAEGTVLLMRHAEKPQTGPDLAPEGQARAQALPRWLPALFDSLQLPPLSTIAAAKDSAQSHRPSLTAQPLAQALGLPLLQPYADKQTAQMADWLRARAAKSSTLVVWHHGQLPRLLAALGADPTQLFATGRWPEALYSQAVLLRFDGLGHLSELRSVTEPPTASPSEPQAQAVVGPNLLPASTSDQLPAPATAAAEPTP